MANFLVPKLPGGLAGSLSSERSSISLDQLKPAKKERQAVRPPVEHKWSLPRLGHDAKPPEIFQHELIQNFSINMFCKVPHISTSVDVYMKVLISWHDSIPLVVWHSMYFSTYHTETGYEVATSIKAAKKGIES